MLNNHLLFALSISSSFFFSKSTEEIEKKQCTIEKWANRKQIRRFVK